MSYHASSYAPGGFASPHLPPQAPPGADQRLWGWFVAVDEDRSGSISARELERALMNGDWTPFDLDTVKLLMSLFDVDRNGKIGFNEFQGLWRYIQDWKNAFSHFDRDRSGTIDGAELQQALSQFGYNLTPNLLHLVQRKYSSTTETYGRYPSGITFDRFVRACVVIKQLTEAFRRLDVNRTGWIQIDYDQFMTTILSLP